MTELRQYFETFVPLTDAQWEDVAGRLTRRQLPKKAFLLEEGERCDFLAFVVKGSFRFYYLKEGEEIVTAFFFPGDFVTNYRSFLTGAPSSHAIQCLRAAEVYTLAKPDRLELYDRYPAMDRLGRLIAERLYLTVAKRLDSFLYETPEDRYRELMDRGSRLLQDVPQYMLASYLGVKPETLSRIRNRR